MGRRRCSSQGDWNAMFLSANGTSGYSSIRREDDKDDGSQSSPLQCDVSYGSEAEYIAEMVKQSFHRCVGEAMVRCRAVTHVTWWCV
jgi:hypothetical protein